MELSRSSKVIKIFVIAMAIFLAVDLAVLGVIIVYNEFFDPSRATVSIPDNLITPDSASSGGVSESISEQLRRSEEASRSDLGVDDSANSFCDDVMPLDLGIEASEAPTSGATPKKEAPVLSLYKRHASDNIPFSVTNMFPGDSETHYYTLKVSYSERITVNFRADIREGYEKLSEVMMVRVTLLTSGKVMYDGLMRDMPEALSYELTANQATTDELSYEITAYLGTSVGNQYQNKELLADFKWWAEDSEHLEPAPPTGDISTIVFIVLVLLSLISLTIVFVIIRRKRAAEAYE